MALRCKVGGAKLPLRRLKGTPAALLALLLATGCRGRTDDLQLVGTVERTLVELSAPISEAIRDVRARRGEHVDAGQVLVQLDTTLAEADLAQAEATLAGARTALLMATNDLQRFTGLKRSRIVSAQDLERAQLAHDDAAARVREAEARIAAARKRVADLTIVSPVAGVVDQIPFDPGERVPAGGVVVVVLEDATPWVRVWIAERSVSHVGPGTPADIRIDGIAETLHGRVLDVARESEFTPHFALTERDRVHLVYETRVTIIDAPPAIRPGLPAEVTILAAAAEGTP
jgi:HlyD family secretion protein